MAEKIIIRDDKGQEHQFTKISDLVAYANSFMTSWLPDDFTWRIQPSWNTSTKKTFHTWLNECPVDWNRDNTDDDGNNEIQVIGFTVPKEVQNETNNLIFCH